jgi:hypothetical protein
LLPEAFAVVRESASHGRRGASLRLGC